MNFLVEITQWWDWKIIRKQISPHFFYYPIEIMNTFGLPVIILTKQNAKKNNWENSNIPKVRVIYLRSRLGNSNYITFDFLAGAFKYIIKNLKNIKLVHMHSIGFIENIFFLYLLKALDIPTIFTLHYIPNPDIYTSLFKKLSVKIFYNLLRLVTYDKLRFQVFTKFQYILYRQFGINKKNIVLIPHGIVTNLFKNQGRKGYLKSKYKLGTFNVLSVANFQEIKGQHLLIDALNYINKHYKIPKGLTLVLVGRVFNKSSRNYLFNIKKRIINYGLKDKVRIILDPPKDDLLQLYLNCDIFIHPTKIEAFSLVIIEALAAGLPIVTIDIPPLNEILSRNVAIFVKRETDDIAKAVLKLYHNKDLRKKMGLEAQREAIKYDLTKVKKKLMNLYKSLMRYHIDDP